MKPPRRTGCYLLHFEPRYRHAAHYLGWASNIRARVADHIAGTSDVRLVRAAYGAGVTMTLSRVWLGETRRDERRRKGDPRGNHHKGSLARYCPICRARKKAEANAA